MKPVGRRQNAEGSVALCRLPAAYCRLARCLLPAAYCLLLSMAQGCVYRSLTIRTEPPGAMVYVNDQLKGESPLTYDFLWYGWHRVTLRKDGFERLDDRKLLRAPVYLWIPFDVAMELVPFRIRDTREWSYALTPSPTLPAPTPPSFDSAQDGAPSEVEGPPTPQPPPSPEPADDTR